MAVAPNFDVDKTNLSANNNKYPQSQVIQQTTSRVEGGRRTFIWESATCLFFVK